MLAPELEMFLNSKIHLSWKTNQRYQYKYFYFTILGLNLFQIWFFNKIVMHKYLEWPVSEN